MSMTEQQIEDTKLLCKDCGGMFPPDRFHRTPNYASRGHRDCRCKACRARYDKMARLRRKLDPNVNHKIRHGHSQRGMAETGAYGTWRAMLRRVRAKPPSRLWLDYAGRGITVCERWRTFENFLADMGTRPDGCSIDRIDVNGNYEPSNCRWASAIEQGTNRTVKRNNKTGIPGVRWTGTRWAATGGFNHRKISLYYGKDFLEACCRRKSWELSRSSAIAAARKEASDE